MARSLWRGLVYKKLSEMTISGNVLDLGGSRNSGYHDLLRGEHVIAVANLDDVHGNEYNFDLEKTFPIVDAAYDALLCINVLEHIYQYHNMLSESHRILKDGGEMIIAVPFLIRVHPSPNDYWRYTEQTLQKILAEAGFTEIVVTPVGTGVFGAAYSLTHNVFRIGLLQVPLQQVVCFLDYTLCHLFPRSSFTKKNYPLGYIVRATKRVTGN